MLRAGVGPARVECVVVIMVACAVWRHGWFGVRPLVFALSACSAVELSKPNMNNGPTVSG